MRKYSLDEAQAQLPVLISRALNNEVVLIDTGSKTVRLVPVAPAAPKRVFGALQGQVRVSAAFFEPLPVEECGA